MSIAEELGERVSVITNKKSNIMVVAPHGFDDTYTAEICFAIQETINCNLVTNNAFRRSDDVDTVNDFANCNNLTHCADPVVYQEFLEPILKFASKKSKYRKYVYFIHGLGSNVGKDFVIGYGLGTKFNRPTIDMNRAEALYLSLSANSKVAFGKGGGKYAAFSKTNLNQVFRNLGMTECKSLQIEISSKLRTDAPTAISTAVDIATTLELLRLKPSPVPISKFEFV